MLEEFNARIDHASLQKLESLKRTTGISVNVGISRVLEEALKGVVVPKQLRTVVLDENANLK